MGFFDFKKKKTNPPAGGEPKKEAVKSAPSKEPKKEVKQKAEVKKESTTTPTTISSGRDLSRVLIQPRITEKATISQGSGVYVFNVDQRANKQDVADAVSHLFKVVPVKVNIAKVPSKKKATRRRGKFGTKSGGKKAYVYLKKGDSISIV